MRIGSAKSLYTAATTAFSFEWRIEKTLNSKYLNEKESADKSRIEIKLFQNVRKVSKR